MVEWTAISARRQDRTVNAWTAGPEGGLPVIFHSGTPSPPVPWPSLEQTCRSMRLRLICPARPGYSGSTPAPGRAVAHAAHDLVSLLDQLGIERFVVLGHSGGGPHALAAAALLPDRCLAAAIVAGVAPYGMPGLDWMQGMGAENVEEFTLALQGEDALRPYLVEYLHAVSGITAQQVADALQGLVSEVDQASLNGELAEVMAQSFRKAAADGLEGWVADDLAFTKAWGFQVDHIEIPVAIWQGRHDRMVPFSHGEWLVDHIPDARPRLLEDEGHVSLLTTRLPDIIADLVDLAGLPPAPTPP